MKKVIILAVSVLLVTCKTSTKKKEVKTETKEEVKTEVKKEAKVEKRTYSLSEAKNSIGFTAYKTTAKVGVKGEFKTVEITNNCEGNTIKDAINGAAFSIPVASLETNDQGRNIKIKIFFFQVMTNSESLEGKFHITDNKTGYVDFTMNGVTNKLPFTYTIKDNIFTMDATMNISSWKATKALNSLNEACIDLHRGEDGASKTWDDVAIHIVSTF